MKAILWTEWWWPQIFPSPTFSGTTSDRHWWWLLGTRKCHVLRVYQGALIRRNCRDMRTWRVHSAYVLTISGIQQVPWATVFKEVTDERHQVGVKSFQKFLMRYPVSGYWRAEARENIQPLEQLEWWTMWDLVKDVSWLQQHTLFGLSVGGNESS